MKKLIILLIKTVELRLKEVTLELQRQQNEKDLHKNITNVFNMDENEQDPVMILNYLKYSRLSLDRVYTLKKEIDIYDISNLNRIIELSNLGYNNSRIIQELNSKHI